MLNAVNAAFCSEEMREELRSEIQDIRRHTLNNNERLIPKWTENWAVSCFGNNGTFSIAGPVLSCLSPSSGWAFGENANTYLYTNATLDLVTSAIIDATYCWIMLLVAPVLFCWQGMFYAITYFFGNGMPEPMRVELSIVGGLLIVSSDLGIKDCKTVNLLPSLLVPVAFYLIKG